MPETRRPRRSRQVWRRRSDGLRVRVHQRRKVPAPGSSDNHWSLVFWDSLDGERLGCAHEADFVTEFERFPNGGTHDAD